MAENHYNLLFAGIARNAPLTLTLPVAEGENRQVASRFIGDSNGGFWIELVASASDLVDELIAGGQPVGITFVSERREVVFAAPILRRQPGRRINATEEVEGLLVAFPTEIKAIDRRTSYRVTVTPDTGLSIRCWRIPENADLARVPAADQELRCELLDISTGGLGLMFQGKDGRLLKVTNKDRFRIELSHARGRLVVEGRMRHPVEPPAAEKIRAGVQFKSMAHCATGKKVAAELGRIVGEIQQAEMARLRDDVCCTPAA